MSEHEALTAALDELDRNDELIAHHQLQVVSLEEMLEESEQARKLEVDAANHVIAELRKENARLKDIEMYIDINTKKGAKLHEFMKERYMPGVSGEHTFDVVIDYIKVLEDGLEFFQKAYKRANKKLEENQ